MVPDLTAPMSDLGPHFLSQRLVKHFSRQQKQTTFDVIGTSRVRNGNKNLVLFQ